MKSLSLVGHGVPQLRDAHSKTMWQSLTIWGRLTLVVLSVVVGLFVFKGPGVAKTAHQKLKDGDPILHVRASNMQAVRAKDGYGRPMSIEAARAAGARWVYVEK